jgi:hypothetical protein
MKWSGVSPRSGRTRIRGRSGIVGIRIRRVLLDNALEGGFRQSLSLRSDMYEARSQLERIHAVGGGKAAIGPLLRTELL